MNGRTEIDPTWAWRPFAASRGRPWNRALAAHLLRRAGFGGSSRELADVVKQDPQEVVARIVSGSDIRDEFQRESDAFAETVLASGDSQQLSAWWAYTLLSAPHPLLEKSTLFWHGHFATSAEKVDDAEAMYNQNRLLRRHALGDFSALVHEISRDPAMLIYLDSITNRKGHPNENYARELMELFCLGEGNYTERDVQQLARCFTGWEIRRKRFRFNRYQHDFAEKELFGKSGNFPEGAAVDLVLAQPAAPRFIVAKLVRFFVFDEPAPTASLVDPLALELVEHNWDIGHVVHRILGSNLFFSEHAVGRKVRSPVDLVVGLLRTLQASTNSYQLADELRQLGQGLFYPPNVKGWDGGRTWINSSTLLGRANGVGRLIRDEKTRFDGGDLAEYFDRLGVRTPEAIVDLLVELTLAVPVPRDARGRLIELASKGQGDRNERIAETVHAMSTLPEFQLG